MIQKTRFVLKNPSAVSSTAINMIYSWGYKDTNGKYKNLKYSTRQSVDPNMWDKDMQMATGAYSAGTNAELATIKAATDKIFFRLQDSGLTPDILKDELDIALGRKTAKLVPEIKTKKEYLLDYVTRYISEMESGTRRTYKDPLKKMSKGTITAIKGFKAKISDYEEATGRRYTFNDIDMKFYKLFIAWLGEQHTVNSTGKIIKQLKTIMQAAMDDQIHTNVAFKMKAFKVTTELVDTIYLNDRELLQLYNKELSGHLEKARDLFLVGCYTLQRISDWDKITKANIKVSPNGTKMVKFRQQKTGAEVSIPLVNPKLIAILEKYDYILPTMPDSKVNLYIKVVCKDPHDHKGEHTSLHKKSSQISSHTARRSGCTNWYMAQIPYEQIMKVSGHKTIAEFKKYIRVTDEEIVEELADNEYLTR